MGEVSKSVPDGVRIVDDRLIKVTDAAGKKLGDLRQREPGAGYLRIRVTGGGCSGLAYKLKFVEAPKAGDLMVQREGVSLLVDTKSALYLKGMILDYSDKLVAGGFKFNNPNAKASCSCGESFAV
ncbi:MAG: HesB/IscA family protein [Opitutales bacterium]|jgi:iron-sulfur cluster assembly protein